MGKVPGAGDAMLIGEAAVYIEDLSRKHMTVVADGKLFQPAFQPYQQVDILTHCVVVVKRHHLGKDGLEIRIVGVAKVLLRPGDLTGMFPRFLYERVKRLFVENISTGTDIQYVSHHFAPPSTRPSLNVNNQPIAARSSIWERR
jgi:hypothetical protein